MWSVERFEELVLNAEAPRVFAFRNSPVGIYELHVGPGWTGALVADLLTGDGATAVALTRDGSTLVPGAATVLQEGDVLHVSAMPAGAATLRERLKGER
jgi:trk system potassium uptake protein TrkA